MATRDQAAIAVMMERVEARNRTETEGFNALIGAYQQIMSQLHYLSTQNQRMHAIDTMGTTDKTIQMKDEQLMQLQKRIYDMEGMGKDMEKEMHGLRDELNRQRLRAELAEQEAEDFRRRVRDLEHQLIEKSKMMQELMLDSSASSSSDASKDMSSTSSSNPQSYIRAPTSPSTDVTMLQNGKSIRAHATEVNSVCFSGSGKVAFTASSDGTVRAWDSYSCQAKADYRGLGMSQPLICVRVSEDGELVLGTGCDRICQVWRVGTGRIAHTLLGHKGKVYAAEFMLDGSTEVLTGGADRSIRVWDVSNGRNLQTFSCRSTCNDLAVAPGGLVASAHQDGAARFWDARTKAPVFEWTDLHADQVTSVSFSKDGTKLLTNSRDNSLQLLDMRMMQVTPGTFQQNVALGLYKSPSYACGFNWSKASLTPDGQFIAAGSTSGSVLIWDAVTTAVWRENKDTHTGAVVGCMWSPSGNMLASCDKNGCLVLWK